MMNLQDSFLNQARIQKSGVCVSLVDGRRILGTLAGFDTFILFLDTEEGQILVYKHAVSTITTDRPLMFGKSGSAAGEGDPV